MVSEWVPFISNTDRSDPRHLHSININPNVTKTERNLPSNNQTNCKLFQHHVE